MTELEQHMLTQHSSFTNCCRSCHLGFNNSHLYAQHARSLHSILVFGAEFQPTQPPDQSAFNGSLQSYSMEPTDDEMVVARDLQAFMKFKQERIQEMIDQKLSADKQKVQFSADVQLLKHFPEPDEDDERITIFANSLMTPVYAEGLSNADISSMVEKLLAVLFTFASSGSGWYGNNCFLYSFVAASYLKSNNFEGEGRKDSLKLTSPEFYQNMPLLQPAGEFTIPMGFNDVDKFETLNDVEVNVFAFEKRDLFPIRLSKRTTFKLSLDLLLLYENDKQHYVLTKDLCRLFCFIKNINFRSFLHLYRNCL